jgi:hypothetical protein
MKKPMTQFAADVSRRTSARLLLCLATVAACHTSGRAQTHVYPILDCVEYFTPPLPAGSIYGSTANEAAGQSYIAHFSYYNPSTTTITIPYGLGFGNYMSPGTQAFTGQPTTFYPGLNDGFRAVPADLQGTWFLNGSTATAIADGAVDGVYHQPLPPSPTCPANFVPATTLTFSTPGTYTRQFLGQVDSGPAADDVNTFAVTAIAPNSHVTLANLTYVPNDSANPSGALNPNSIYGDITITEAPTTTIPFRLQLAAGGQVIVKGIDVVNYTGRLATIDATSTTLTSSAATIDQGFSVELTAQVLDTTRSTQSPTGAVTFYETISGNLTTLGTGSVTSGSAHFTYFPSTTGIHNLTATFSPDDATLYQASTGSVSVYSEVILRPPPNYVWVLNGDGSVVGISANGAVAIPANFLGQSTSAAGGIAIDSGSNAWSVSQGHNVANRLGNDGLTRATFTGAGLSAPTALAIDGAGSVWIVNAGNNSVSLFSNNGTPLSPATGLASTTLSSPASISIDPSGSVWVANSGSNSVTEIIGAAAPVAAPLVNALKTSKLGTRP